MAPPARPVPRTSIVTVAVLSFLVHQIISVPLFLYEIAGKVKDVASVHGTLWPDHAETKPILNLAIVTGAFQPLDHKPD